MNYIVMGVVIFSLFLAIIIKGFIDDKKYKTFCINLAKESFGKKSKREYSKNELDSIKHYFELFKNTDYIDDITSNDLNIDDLYKAFNISLSAPGDEVFYKKLRSPIYDKDNLDLLDRKSDYFLDNDLEREKLQIFFLSIGRIKGISFIEFINILDEVNIRKPFKELILLLLFLISFSILFFDASLGIVFLVLIFIVNILDYYKERGKIENYIIGLSYAVKLIDNALRLPDLNSDLFTDDIYSIKDTANSLKCIKRFYGLIKGHDKNLGAGNPLDIFVDYLRMFFHLDIIRFYKVLSLLKEHKDDICKLYNDIGELEFYLNVASIKKCYKYRTRPNFCNEGISAVNIYHPLIDNPVKNSFSQRGGFLITGSNASGKSTFLRTVALNILFSQTLNVAFADEFSLCDVKLITSLSINDNLLTGDSYFMAEIKSLKRVFDSINESIRLCVFTDELLRGTNTIERIAAVSKILDSLFDNGAYVFAATHDIELTDILSDKYENYHFEEEFVNNDVIFNYLLKEGRATSKNAIKLLSILGFDNDLVVRAQDMADNFISTGLWKG